MSNSNPLPINFCLKEWQEHPEQITAWSKSNNPLLSSLAKEVIEAVKGGSHESR